MHKCAFSCLSIFVNLSIAILLISLFVPAWSETEVSPVSKGHAPSRPYLQRLHEHPEGDAEEEADGSADGADDPPEGDDEVLVLHDDVVGRVHHGQLGLVVIHVKVVGAALEVLGRARPVASGV